MELTNGITQNERIAQQLVGMDGTGEIHINGESAKEIMARERASKFNTEVDEKNKAFDDYTKSLNEATEKLSQDLNQCQIMPIGQYLLIEPLKTNPFQKIIKEGSIITDLGGMRPTYKSHETGQVEEAEEGVVVGTVVETGTDVKFIKPGDVVFYTKFSSTMVPFYKFGFEVCAENRIIAVVNSNLTERKQQYGR